MQPCSRKGFWELGALADSHKTPVLYLLSGHPLSLPGWECLPPAPVLRMGLGMQLRDSDPVPSHLPRACSTLVCSHLLPPHRLALPSSNLSLPIQLPASYPPPIGCCPKAGAEYMVDPQQTLAEFIFVCNLFLLLACGSRR